MKFGITTSKIDEIGLIARAENLGYDFCWVSDTQMIRSNPWAVLALAAHQTRTIRIGTGGAVAGLRLAPVTANAIATINRIAPGRTFLGIGTGNTAMRAMGQAPMGVKAFGEYIRVVQGLLRGDEVEYTLNGVTHPIQFQNQEFKYIDVENHIPVHVGGFGPRAQALAGEIGDGLITGIPRGGTIPQAIKNVQKGAKKSILTKLETEVSTRQNAFDIAKKAKDKSIHNFIQWRHLLTTGNQASFYDYKVFIDRNSQYPRIDKLRFLAEHKLSTAKISPKKIINWFDQEEPLSGYGKMILGESYALTGNKTKGTDLIKEGWITAKLSKNCLLYTSPSPRDRG